MVDIKQLELLYFQNDEPVEYKLKNKNSKGYVIKIKPILLKNWSIFENSLDLLKQEQQDYNEPNIISMSYLEFIINILFKMNPTYMHYLSLILEISMDLKNIRLGKINDKDCLVIMNDKDEQEAIITSKEFSEIKKIILYQNIPNYEDEYISNEVKLELIEYENLKYKNMEISEPSLEKQKIFVISKTGILMDSLNNMTYRTFIQVYQSIVENDLYFSQKIIQASEKYKIEGDVIYPLYKNNNSSKLKDRLKEAFKDKRELESKIK